MGGSRNNEMTFHVSLIYDEDELNMYESELKVAVEITRHVKVLSKAPNELISSSVFSKGWRVYCLGKYSYMNSL